MGGVEVGIEVVSGVLHSGELADVVLLRHDDHAAGMLTGGAFDAGTAQRKAILLCLIDNAVAFA